MKRKTFTTLFTLLLLLTGSVFAQNADKIGSPIPSPFSFEEIDGTALTNSDIVTGKPVLVFYFDPECDHCQEISHRINENIAAFDNATVLFVTYAEMETIKAFPAKYIPNAVGRKNFHFGNDTNYKFDSWFGYSEAPTLHIYNSKGVKAKVYRQEAEVAEILLYLK